jgi:hypothetical protein
MMGEVEVIVTKPGAKGVIVVDKATGKLLLFTMTYNKKVEPGRYEEPEEVVEVFRQLATRGHDTKDEPLNPELIYRVILQILRSDIPFDDKLRELYKYVRSR